MKRTTAVVLCLAAVSLTTTGAAPAQTAPPAQKPSALSALMARMHHARDARVSSGAVPPRAGSQSAPPMSGSGTIIGDKKTHVFHLPGSQGALPAPRNRVYFQSPAQAQAAGYHQAGLSSGRGAGTASRRTPARATGRS